MAQDVRESPAWSKWFSMGHADSHVVPVLSLGPLCLKVSGHTEASHCPPGACRSPKSCPRKTAIRAIKGCMPGAKKTLALHKLSEAEFHTVTRVE